ncbi:RNA polymerase sigma factor [Streptomyces sp. NPDC051636]|uniref:RNA polymerase sigma factor n=1 Tax=Streptomyces sp. NPDC051636 TaxID=3365663 RepID=UPI0037BA10ED
MGEFGVGNKGDTQAVQTAQVRIPDQRTPADLGRLMDRCREGDGRAWEQLIHVYSPVVWTVVRSHGLKQADCEDVYQLTWQRLVEHIHTLKQPGRVAAWLVTVAKREAISRARQARRMVSVPDPADYLHAADMTVPAPEEWTVARSDSERLRKAIRNLPEEHQALLGLLFAEPPLSYDYIAEAVGMARGSIGPTRRRILAKMRGELAGEERG